MANVGARVYGVREFNRNLRAAGVATRELSEPGRKMAQEFVIPHALYAASRLGRGYVRAAFTLRPASSVNGGAVRLGDRQVPDALGWEFGSYRNNRRKRMGPGSSRSYVGYRQFREWRGSRDDAGYFLWPTIRRDLPHLQQEYLKKLAELGRRYGLNSP